MEYLNVGHDRFVPLSNIACIRSTVQPSGCSCAIIHLRHPIWGERGEQPTYQYIVGGKMARDIFAHVYDRIVLPPLVRAERAGQQTAG